MSAGTEMTNGRLNGVVDDSPSTPPEALSQQSIPSTEAPGSPIDPSLSFKTELNNDRITHSQVVPSSLTPPPSSQVPQTNGGDGGGMALGSINSQRASMFSPPATSLNTIRRDGTAASEYLPPTDEQIADASAEELRTMFQACRAENARLKMETAHHKLQYNLLSMQAEEEKTRDAVELTMARREVQVLREVEDQRQARRELSSATESTQAKYIQLKVWYETAIEENEGLKKRAKLAKKVIQQQEDQIVGLREQCDIYVTRIRENREHFRMLCSPGGAFHGALTPKTLAAVTPQQSRTTPRQTPRTLHLRDQRHDHRNVDILIQALNHNHDNHSAPSTPVTASRPAPRMPSKHTRGAQSLSSLPTTPMERPRGQHASLLPSIDLVPHTEPPPRFGGGGRFVPETPKPNRGRKSRESTISADENEELDRAALESNRAVLESMAGAAQSFLSHNSRSSGSRPQRHDEEEEVLESQASQAASEMLRRDPRESFEVASSVGSRDGTPAPAEKSAKLQAKLFAPVNKTGLPVEKRKHGVGSDAGDNRREEFTSPTKKIRYGGDGSHRVGLGIQYSQEA